VSSGRLCCFRAICRQFGVNTGRLTLAALVFAAGMFTSSTAFLPSSFAMKTTMMAIGFWYIGNISGAVFFTALGALVGWPFAAALGYDDIAWQNLWCCWTLIELQMLSCFVAVLYSFSVWAPSPCYCDFQLLYAADPGTSPHYDVLDMMELYRLFFKFNPLMPTVAIWVQL